MSGLRVPAGDPERAAHAKHVISYRGYHAQITYDPSADAFHGRVLGMQDVISFYGRTPDELREEMKAAVEDYVAWCEQEGDKPEKSWAGKLTLRPDEDVRDVC